MKKKAHQFCFVLLFNLLAFSQVGSAQKPMNLPDYLFTEGANPAVMFTLKKLPEKVSNNSITIGGIVLSKTNMSKFVVGNGASNLFMNYLVEDLDKANIKPEVFIDKGALEESDMSFVELDNHIREQLHKNKVRYILEFMIYVTPEDKLVEKGKATREDFKTAVLMIHKYNGGSLEIITSDNFSNAANRDDYKKLINYFVGKVKSTSMEQLSIAIKEAPYYNHPYRAYKEINKFPSDLMDQVILLVTPQKYKMENGKSKMVDDEKLLASMTKELDKNYQYRYKFVSAKALEAKRGTEAYLLEAKMALFIQTKVDRSKGGTTSQEVARFYYVIRDLENNDVYYGGVFETLEAKADRNVLIGLKDFNKRLKKELGIK